MKNDTKNNWNALGPDRRILYHCAAYRWRTCIPAYCWPGHFGGHRSCRSHLQKKSQKISIGTKYLPRDCIESVRYEKTIEGKNEIKNYLNNNLNNCYDVVHLRL